eukprot:4280474-Alexandrium_andersonii.AAC.1
MRACDGCGAQAPRPSRLCQAGLRLRSLPLAATLSSSMESELRACVLHSRLSAHRQRWRAHFDYTSNTEHSGIGA